MAESGPELHLDYSAWKATDVVIVDSKGVILEVWKGVLKLKSTLPVERFKNDRRTGGSTRPI
jgi:hypothetical protein